MKKIVRNKKGFTLIELMAVIVILAVVMLLVANRIGNTSKDAKGRAFYIELKAVRKNVEQDCLLNGFVKQSSLEEYVTKGETSVSFVSYYANSGVTIRVKAEGSKFKNINIPPELGNGTDKDNNFEADSTSTSTIPNYKFTIANCRYENDKKSN